MHRVQAKSILSTQNGMNLYRGCTHGCIYCDSRSTCYGMEHLFEDVEVKVNAPELLEAALSRKRKRSMIFTGAMSDPYNPLEKELCLTRRCLEVIERHGFGAGVLTKSDLILRDRALISRIHRQARAVVQMTLTTCDESLCRILEPNVCTTARRVEVLRAFHEEGVPTAVWLCPLLPFINDSRENLLGLLDCCREAGVKAVVTFGLGLTLRDGDRQYFYRQLDRYFPGMKERYIRTYGSAYQLPLPHEKELWALLEQSCRKADILYKQEEVFAWLQSPEEPGERLRLF